MSREFEGKKILIMGGNPETVPLVEIAKSMGVRTIVVSARSEDPAKKAAWKSSDVDGMDVPGIVSLAQQEHVNGVMVGVADILVPYYCRVCDALNLPCYATEKIVEVFSYKDIFKDTCEKFGIHGVPEFHLDQELHREDLEKIQYPVIVKPVDNGGGVGISVANNETELKNAVSMAIKASHSGRFIVEKYMQCDDMGIYYTFKDGYCSASCVYDRYTTGEQEGVSRVCLGGTYPSRHLSEYFDKMHRKAVNMFQAIGIKNGVLMLTAFYENGEFYVYDTGFRLQGEACHLIMKAVHGFDQRELLIRFALTGSEGNIDLKKEDDVHLRGKHAATLWFLLREGVIGRIEGLENCYEDPAVIYNGQRLYEGDIVLPEWIGNEKQVLTRLILLCNTREDLKERLKYYQNTVHVYDQNGIDMLLKGFDVEQYG